MKGGEIMKIVFITNFMTEHQKYLSLAMNGIPDVDYLFIETKEPDDSFQSLNCKDELLDFVVRYDEFRLNNEKYLRLIYAADVVIHGSAPDSLIIKRIKDGKLTFRYCERFYKDGITKVMYIRDRLAAWLHHGRFKNNNLYMLCSSAFTYADSLRFGNYKDKCYKWGYYPRTEIFDIEKTVEEKKPGTIIWASRFIDWKHPEIPVMIAERLKNEGYDFSMTLFGKGEMFEEISDMIRKKGLEDKVFLDDSKNSEELREIMKESCIFLHTANRREGWGVVLNEAMNSGCAVVASHIVGAVPYLIKDGDNGVVFKDGDVDDLYKKIKSLLDDPEKTKYICKNAYKTVTEMWNCDNTANRFVSLAKEMLSGNMSPELFESGPCSKAEIIEDNWYENDRKE